MFTVPLGFAKVLHKPTGLVLLRHAADASEITNTHPDTYALAPRDSISIPEQLAALGSEALREYARRHGIHAPAGVEWGHVIAQLVPRIEAGEIPPPSLAGDLGIAA